MKQETKSKPFLDEEVQKCPTCGDTTATRYRSKYTRCTVYRCNCGEEEVIYD